MTEFSPAFTIFETEAVSMVRLNQDLTSAKWVYTKRLSAAVDLFDLGSTDIPSGTMPGYFCLIVDLYLGKLLVVLLRFLCDPTLCRFWLPLQRFI